MMHGVMKTKWINVGETKISKLLSKINPEAQTKRKDVADRSFNPKAYNVKQIRYNQNENLGMFGVVHGCGRDRGFSGKIVGHAKMA